MKVFKSADFKGIKRCNKRRERNLPLTNGKKEGTRYDRAVFVKAIIRECLRVLHFDPVVVEDYIYENFLNNMEFPTKKSAEEMAEEAFMITSRYLEAELDRMKTEDRRVDICIPKKSIIVPKFDLKVNTHPEAIFKGVKSYDEEYSAVSRSGKLIKKKEKVPHRYIEAVKYAYKLPDVTQSGKKMDHSVLRSIELYFFLLYLKETLTEADAGIKVEASYYFLRNKEDSRVFSNEFFREKNSNVVTLSIENTPHAWEMLDLQFLPQIEEFLKGVDSCDEADCKYCEFYNVCNYTKPPKSLPEEIKEKEGPAVFLTPAQEEAIDARNGIYRINAGPGGGKTFVLAHRIAYMLEEGVQPEKILMLVFGNEAGKEMKRRVEKDAKDIEVDFDQNALFASTFHSFGNEIIQKHYDLFGFSAAPTLLEDNSTERYALIKGLLDKHYVRGLDYKNLEMDMPAVKGGIFVAAEAFRLIKTNNLTPGDEETLKELLKFPYRLKDDKGFEDLLRLYDLYDDILHDHNYIEYADMEAMLVNLIHDDPFFFESYNYEHIIVDEFQDTNDNQFEIIKALIDTPSFKSLMVVGDDSQSIYSFRGTTPKFIINFFDSLGEEGHDIYMMENHRSTPEIIDFSNKLIAKNTEKVIKELIPVRPSLGKDVEVHQFWKPEDEWKFIADTILHKNKECGVVLEDIAFIAQTRNELLKIGTYLSERDIPWVMINPEPLLQNSRVLGAISLCKFIRDNSATKDAFTYINTVKKNQLLDTESDESIENMILKLAEKCQGIIEFNNLPQLTELFDALDDEDEIFDKFKEKVFSKPTVADMITFCVDFSIYGKNQTAKRTKRYPGVVLTTAHSAKGLEWPVVFNSISKYDKTKMSMAEVEEKRRLFFVSATRARDELYVTSVTRAERTSSPNRFLTEALAIVRKPLETVDPYTKKKIKA